tara:strand:+ start:66 stop:347 length:282 start_codon:yes stop_codon:yes gene_type:complete
MTSTNKSEKSHFADSVFKIAPTIGIAIVAYLQTLFPSKDEFNQMQEKLNQMDKKITEMSVMQTVIDHNTRNLSKVEERVRGLEINQAKQQKIN